MKITHKDSSLHTISFKSLVETFPSIMNFGGTSAVYFQWGRWTITPCFDDSSSHDNSNINTKNITKITECSQTDLNRSDMKSILLIFS